MLVHSVYFYLKPELTAAQRAEFLHEGLETLQGIKAMSGYYIGKPAPTPPRPVVDASYDYAITCLLADMKAHDAYQVDPLHTAFVARFKSYWTTVKIYDAE